MEFKNNVPIYLQVIEDIKNRIVLGEVALGDKLPSTRELAIQYQINPNTAVRVYNEMELDGIVFTKRGLGTFVTEDAIMFESMKESMVKSYVCNFIEGMIRLGISKDEMIQYVREYSIKKEDENGKV